MKKPMMKSVGIAAFAVVAMVLTGCEPKDVSLLKKGTKLELTGKFAEAAEKYAEAASLGNSEAYKKLGDMAIAHDFLRLTPENANDFITGHDKWLADAQQAVTKAKDYFEKAQMAGCTNMLQVSLDKLSTCEKKIAETASKVNEAKAKEKLRLEEERKKREEEERIAREKREEAERIAKAEAKRLAEEEAKKNSPEYCIDNNLVLTAPALKEVIKELTFYSKTGNDIFDKEENHRHWSRFQGKHIAVSGNISKVQVTMFTRQVKCIVRVNGGTISARFDGMSRDEAAGFRVGEPITFEGYISQRPVTSTFAMDRCSRR